MASICSSSSFNTQQQQQKEQPQQNMLQEGKEHLQKQKANLSPTASRSATPPAVVAPAAVASPPNMKNSPTEASADLSSATGNPLAQSDHAIAAAPESEGEATKRSSYRREPRDDDERKVFVGNLALNTTEEATSAHFSVAGKIESVKILQTRNRSNRRFAFIVYESKECQTKAIETLNGSVLDGAELSVQLIVVKKRLHEKSLHTGAPRRPRRPTKNTRTHDSNSPLEGSLAADASRPRGRNARSTEGTENAEMEGEEDSQGRVTQMRLRRVRHRNPMPRQSNCSDPACPEGAPYQNGGISAQDGNNVYQGGAYENGSNYRQFAGGRDGRGSSWRQRRSQHPDADQQEEPRNFTSRPRNPRSFPRNDGDKECQEENAAPRGDIPSARQQRTRHEPRQSTRSRSATRAPGVPSETGIFVANIHYRAHNTDFRDFFVAKGFDVVNAYIARDTSFKSKGFAFAEFKSQEDQQRALNELQGQIFFDRKISVRVAIKPAEGASTPHGAASAASGSRPEAGSALVEGMQSTV